MKKEKINGFGASFKDIFPEIDAIFEASRNAQQPVKKQKVKPSEAKLKKPKSNA